jgi:hypothetical protein
MRRPEKLKKNFLNQLWRSKPITPKPQPPAPLKPDGWGVDAYDLQFFSDFGDFANVVNGWLSDPDVHPDGPWRLQELSDPSLSLDGLGLSDTPSYGRRYTIFYNRVHVGLLELCAHYEYTTQNPRIATYIRIEWARLMAFGVIQDFFHSIALHTCHLPPLSPEYFDALHRMNHAMTDLLWQTQEVSKFELGPDYGQVELRLDGLAKSYLRKKALRER